eukprot:1152732-Pelagomonas_calceolata.AAC.2
MQFELYNARDLEKFMDLFTEDVIAQDAVTDEVLASGKAQLRPRCVAGSIIMYGAHGSFSAWARSSFFGVGSHLWAAGRWRGRMPGHVCCGYIQITLPHQKDESSIAALSHLLFAAPKWATPRTLTWHMRNVKQHADLAKTPLYWGSLQGRMAFFNVTIEDVIAFFKCSVAAP